jgi:hypothetical protein
LPSPRTATGAARDRHLVENLARGGQRFGEDGALERDAIRQHVQVAFRQSEEFLETLPDG